MGNLRTESPATQEPEASNWLTPKDVQRELRIGQRLTYKLLRTGAIPSIRVGGMYRIPGEALEELRDRAIPTKDVMSA